MRFIKSKLALRVFLCLLSVAILISIPILAKSGKAENKDEESLIVLNVWEVDSFEGGKGSRANFLQRVGDELPNCYVKVTTLTAEAARQNLKSGNIPDMISYGAGTFGLEQYINDRDPFSAWCRGGYCLLSIVDSADFADITSKNTLINCGIDNNVEIAAMFEGLSDAVYEKPTGAYVDLINGKYKYLLGTQRDIFRLQTRGVAFKVKPLTKFNDIYQLISITSKDDGKIESSRKFIAKLKESWSKLDQIGMLDCQNRHIYDGEMNQLEDLEFDLAIKSPMSLEIKTKLDEAVKNKDENQVKSLLK